MTKAHDDIIVIAALTMMSSRWCHHAFLGMNMPCYICMSVIYPTHCKSI